MVRDALATHYNVSLLASLDLEFRALYLNVYFARTALSEPARNALDCRTFPFFSNKIFALPLGEFLYELAEGMCNLLEATQYAPHSPLLQPYSGWLETGAVFFESR